MTTPETLNRSDVPVPAKLAPVLVPNAGAEECAAAQAQEVHETLQDIREGLTAADRGDTVDHEAVVKELRERLAGRVPDEVLHRIR